MLITTSELESKLEQPELLLIDTRSFKEYSEGHIPGSVNLDLFAFHWIDTTKEGIQNFNKQAETIFSFVGISSEKKVVF
ncbi:MAG: sulfurtransferase, partial [Thaumarchaeota archaeon]|nr:sulfurtransferase [Nitrososphaerota archaeon]